MYDKLHKIIVEAVPEIMELKRGCKVKIKYNIDADWAEATYLGLDKHTMMYQFILRYSGVVYRTSDKYKTSQGNIEILGRDITLEDVVKAIEKGFKYCPSCNGKGGGLGESLGYVECNECGGDGQVYEDREWCENYDSFYPCGCSYDDFIAYLMKIWMMNVSFEKQHEIVHEFLLEVLSNK